MNIKIKGPAIRFGNNIDTDVILPGKYLTLVDPYELAKHALESIDPDFPQKAKNGVVLVGGKNFGCGSSREQAPLALKYAGVKCVLAESFARIFFRNAINIGLPLLESAEAVDGTGSGDELEIDLEKGEIKNLTTGQIFHAKPYPEFMSKLIKAGGLIEYTKERLAAR